MTDMPSPSYTCFNGYQHVVSGPLQAIVLVVKRAIQSEPSGPILIFDDATGRSIDIDLRGSDNEVVARFAPSIPINNDAKSAVPGDVEKPRDRGRPKLGVVPREVTLLPRHWDWLATQPGGASVALRKLVEEARRANSDKDKLRQAQERAYHFMSAVAGNLPNFEEATRALFANDQTRFHEFVTLWPDDLRKYAIRLAFGDDNSVLSQSLD